MANFYSGSEFHKISPYMDDTFLVQEMLGQGLFSTAEMKGTRCKQAFDHVYQWLNADHLFKVDLQKVIQTGVPVIDSQYGTWVGVPKFFQQGKRKDRHQLATA